MSGVNKVILVGRLGKDPEVKHLESGAVVANFSMATSEKWTDKSSGEVKETTEWHNVVIWKGLAEVVEKYVKKGDQIYIEGKLTTRSWEKDGVKRYTTEIIGKNMVMLGGGNTNSNPAPASAPTPQEESHISDNEATDDLPF